MINLVYIYIDAFFLLADHWLGPTDVFGYYRNYQYMSPLEVRTSARKRIKDFVY